MPDPFVTAETAPSADLPTEWPATVPTSVPKSRNTALWIVLGIFAFILVCCCVLALVVTIVSSNDSALQRELSLFAGIQDRTSATTPGR
jgi:threonine/homoserine/homoserine lactone efflux protein